MLRSRRSVDGPASVVLRFHPASTEFALRRAPILAQRRRSRLRRAPNLAQRRPTRHPRAPILASVDRLASVAVFDPACQRRPTRLRRAPIPASVDGRPSVVLRSQPQRRADPPPSCSDSTQRRRSCSPCSILLSVDGATSVVLRSQPASTDPPPSCSDPGQRQTDSPPSRLILASVDRLASVVKLRSGFSQSTDPPPVALPSTPGVGRTRLRRAPNVPASVDGRPSVVLPERARASTVTPPLVLRSTPSVDRHALQVVLPEHAQRRPTRLRRAPIPANVDGRASVVLLSAQRRPSRLRRKFSILAQRRRTRLRRASILGQRRWTDIRRAPILAQRRRTTPPSCSDLGHRRRRSHRSCSDPRPVVDGRAASVVL